MFTKLKSLYKSLSRGEKVYAKTVVPLWLSFSIYVLVGIPIL